jgi:hypothetical protein
MELVRESRRYSFSFDLIPASVVFLAYIPPGLHLGVVANYAPHIHTAHPAACWLTA